MNAPSHTQKKIAIIGLVYSTDLSELSEATIYIITVPTPINAYMRPNLTPLLKASETVGSVLKKCDIVIYESTVYPGATKKANENMAHSYAHLWDLPTTMFRFFAVYGTWGSPDLALYKFVDAILDGRPIDIYNLGDMYRDFTYVDDLARGIRLLIDAVPERLGRMQTCSSA